MLTIRCQFHPGYKATKKLGNNCETCKLLFTLTHQNKHGQEKLLGELDSKLATAVGGDEWDTALTGMEAGKTSSLSIACSHHRYRATRKPGWDCGACRLLFCAQISSS